MNYLGLKSIIIKPLACAWRYFCELGEIPVLGTAICWFHTSFFPWHCTRALSHWACCSCCWLLGGNKPLEQKADHSQLPVAFQVGEQPQPFLCRCTDLHFQEPFGLLCACRWAVRLADLSYRQQLFLVTEVIRPLPWLLLFLDI